MTNKNCIIALLGAALLAGCNSKPAGVGSYIASDADGAFMVQITSIKDGRVNGTLSVIGATEDGKTPAVTRPISGTIEGNTLNLTVENGTGLSLVTGAIDGDDLRLTLFGNGNSTQLTLAKSDASKFEELANGQRYRAAEKLQQVETAAASKEQIELRSKTQESINQLADSMFSKAEEAKQKAKKIDVVIAEYRAGNSRTAKMESAKQSANGETVEGSYRVTQLEYQIDGISNEMSRVHDQVVYYRDSLELFFTNANSKSSQFLAECAADALLNCSRLSAAKQSLSSNYRQFQQSFQRENAAYNSKRI